MGNYITIKQACEHYKVTRKTIYNWRRKGLLKEKSEGRSVLLEAESIEAQITHKLPIAPNQNLDNITQEIHELKAKIDHLEGLVTQLLPKAKGTNTQILPKNAESSGKVTQTTHYEKRTQAAIEKARNTFLELGMPSITKKELAEKSRVSRGTVQKYWALITQSDLPNE
ncbi:helix-turn-helix domain-containing protein [Vibrio parahaemolyticus]|nr:helix-turn-helix domain-containing protein [Vibrio parahaemolyticus]